jgi:DNA processing protein
MTGSPPAANLAVRLARIALGHLVEPGNRDLGLLVNRVGPVEGLRLLRLGDVAHRLRDTASARLAALDPSRIAEKALERADRLGVRIITPEDAEWPEQLGDLVSISRDVPDPIHRDTFPPHCIWLRGPWALAEACERSVAVVGARASTAYGEHVAGDLAYGLADRGWTVISGGAFGIDAAAHRGALAGGGCTIAVLACGIDRPYPLSHTAMFDRIGEHGLLFSEWPPGSDPHRRRFLIRNRVIAAAAQGTVMVEASVRSGARFTLNRARLLNRHCLAVPGPVTSVMSIGCHDEIRNGGTILVTGVADVIDGVGRIGEDLAPVRRAAQSPRDLLTPLQQQVLDGVRPRKVLTAEQLAAVVGVSPRDARRTLPSLEHAGFIVSVGAGYRLRRKSDARSGTDPPRRPPRSQSTVRSGREPVPALDDRLHQAGAIQLGSVQRAAQPRDRHLDRMVVDGGPPGNAGAYLGGGEHPAGVAREGTQDGDRSGLDRHQLITDHHSLTAYLDRQRTETHPQRPLRQHLDEHRSQLLRVRPAGQQWCQALCPQRLRRQRTEAAGEHVIEERVENVVGALIHKGLLQQVLRRWRADEGDRVDLSLGHLVGQAPQHISMVGRVGAVGKDFDDLGARRSQRVAEFSQRLGVQLGDHPPARHRLGEEVAEQVLRRAGGGGPDLGEAEFPEPVRGSGVAGEKPRLGESAQQRVDASVSTGRTEPSPEAERGRDHHLVHRRCGSRGARGEDGVGVRLRDGAEGLE